MPPSYGELPSPKPKKTLTDNENNIKNLIGKSKNEIPQANKSKNQSNNLEESILGKIKKN